MWRKQNLSHIVIEYTSPLIWNTAGAVASVWTILRCHRRRRTRSRVRLLLWNFDENNAAYSQPSLSMFSSWLWTKEILESTKSRVGTMVRASTFHQRGAGSICWPAVLCGLSLVVLNPVLRGFPLSPKTNNWFDLWFSLICCPLNQ